MSCRQGKGALLVFLAGRRLSLTAALLLNEA